MWNLSAERAAIYSATVELDTTSDPLELAKMSRDCLTEGSRREDAHLEILASIPPVKLGRTVYRVVTGGSWGFDLAGPRGGMSSLVQALRDPSMGAQHELRAQRAHGLVQARDRRDLHPRLTGNRTLTG